MAKLSSHRVLLLGILSPLAAVLLYTLVYSLLTQLSRNLEKDWMFRLAVSALAMTVPFLFTLWMAIKEGRQRPLLISSKIGLAIAFLSLALLLHPLRDGILRLRQTRNLALRGDPAPLFDTTDIFGNSHRLADYRGQVVLVNIWATWCEPCRSEMPNLDKLYREQKDKGFVVFGMSDESLDTQRKFLQQIPVSYPLLTYSGHVPDFYRDIARYPAIFLIDRQGHLQPAPAPGQPFEKLTATVDSLLTANPR